MAIILSVNKIHGDLKDKSMEYCVMRCPET